MINIIKKDITTINSPAIIMHGVNCQGKMGSGVAKALFTKWSDVREKYLTIPVDKMELGLTQIVNVEKDLYVANCFTQEFYGYDGKKYADETAILKCLFDVTALANCLKIYDIYSPKIGCGLGGLNWEEDVFCQFQNVSRMDYNFNFYICEI